MIRIENLTKKYAGEYVLKDANFNINKNETLAIIGPSGSGKTTLLRLINTLDKPSRGAIYIDDHKLTMRSSKALRLKIGMVFQHCHLFPHMNAIQNLTYAPLKVLHQDPAEAFNRALELLSYFGLKSKAEAMPNDLSGGQKQRVAIARALMMRPEVMFFDEPTSALDPEVIKDVCDAILNLKKDMTVVVVTHHLKFAHKVADRIIFMDAGQILCDQKTEDFFLKPKSHRARLFLENVGDFM
ncbi:MAG: amino acid ABC transporter ATP-binding protein [Pseudomonadota bacterium]